MLRQRERELGRAGATWRVIEQDREMEEDRETRREGIKERGNMDVE